MPTRFARPLRPRPPAAGRRRLSLPRLVLAAAVVCLGLAGGPRAASAAPTPVARLTWCGQSCFLLESMAGTRVVMDPAPDSAGHTPPASLRADVVTVSHEHADHNHTALVAGRVKVLRGLTADKKGWMKVDEKVKDVQIRTVGVYHDDEKGTKRGLNTVFVFEVGGVRIAHLGDLGHMLDHKQLSAIGSIDVALVPVGGGATIDAQRATRVIEQLRPRLVVVPMHYKTDATQASELAGVEPFLSGKRNVTRVKGATLDLLPWKTKPAAQIMVLDRK